MCVFSLPEFVRPQSRFLDRSILRHSISGLQPNTLYSVSIHALYSNTEGPEITLSQQTGTDSKKRHNIEPIPRYFNLNSDATSLLVQIVRLLPLY